MRLHSILLISTLLFYIHFSAQNFLSGIVKDANTNQPLIGVTIQLDNGNGSVTNASGKYSIKSEKELQKITFSYVGYQTKTIELNIVKFDHKDVYLVENNSELNLMVVSASKFEQKLEEVTVSMDVIDPKLIESKNCIILSDLIRNLPSVQLTDGQLNIRSGSGWSYGTGSRVLVMVDDMPILSADQGEVDFNLIPMEIIDKIEIIKGASSALYGSSALNGVINIKTKSPSYNP